MIKWKKLIQQYIKEENINKEEALLLLKTAEAAELMKEKLLQYSTDDIEMFCKMEFWNKKITMYDEIQDILLPGYTTSDWTKFLTLPIIDEQITLQQNIINSINKKATTTKAIQSGDIKSLKDVKSIEKNTKSQDQQIFVYVNAESLLSDKKVRIWQKCPCGCGHIFLTQYLTLGEEEYV